MLACTLGESAANNQVDSAVSLNFIEDDIGFKAELRQYVTAFAENLTVVRTNFDHIAKTEFFHWRFKH